MLICKILILFDFLLALITNSVDYKYTVVGCIGKIS